MSAESNELNAPGSRDASPDRVTQAERAQPSDRLMISRFFSWHEVVASQTAERIGIDNTPPAELIDRIAFTAVQMDRVRKLLGGPVYVSSWFRSRDVNIMVGGAATAATLRAALAMSPHEAVCWKARARLERGEYSTSDSQHTLGIAVDFRCPAYGAPRLVYEFLKPLMADLSIDQLILEYPERPHPWVHASFREQPRLQAWVHSEPKEKVA